MNEIPLPVDMSDPKQRMAYVRSLRRTRVLPVMGEQPELQAGIADRPPETPNPMLAASEPFSFDPPPRPNNFNDGLTPWPVVEADIEELLEWGLPRYQEIYPRCTYDSVKPMLIVATRGGRMRFLRTKNGASLFIAETTPWEPELYVYQVFVITRITAPKEAYRLVRESWRWAHEIGAVAFEFGRATQEAEKLMMDRIRPEGQAVRYVKALRPPVVVSDHTVPGARMIAMGMKPDEPRAV